MQYRVEVVRNHIAPFVQNHEPGIMLLLGSSIISDWSNMFTVGSSCCSCVTIRLVQYVLHVVPVSLSDWYNMFSVGSPCYCCVTVKLADYVLGSPCFCCVTICLVEHILDSTTAVSLSNWSIMFSVGSPCHATIRLVQYVLGGFSELLLCHYQIAPVCYRWVIRATARSQSVWSNMYSVGSPCYCCIIITLVQYILGGFSMRLLCQ